MFDFDLESGNISNRFLTFHLNNVFIIIRKTIIKIDDGLPDGMCIDEEGIFLKHNKNIIFFFK